MSVWSLFETSRTASTPTFQHTDLQPETHGLDEPLYLTARCRSGSVPAQSRVAAHLALRVGSVGDDDVRVLAAMQLAHTGLHRGLSSCKDRPLKEEVWLTKIARKRRDSHPRSSSSTQRAARGKPGQEM